MKKFILILLAISAVAILANCIGPSNLPAEVPGDVTMVYASQGGMVPYLFRVTVAGRTMKVENRSGQPPEISKPELWEAKISDEDLKKLYRVFVENRIDAMRPNTPSQVADGKSRSVELKFGASRYYAVTGDGIDSAVRDLWRFNKIESAVTGLVEKYRPDED